MEYTVWGEQLFTAHFSGAPVFFQPVRFNRDLSLDGGRSSVVVYDNPTFTSLQMRVYSYKGSAPRQLIATSGAKTKSEIISLAAGIRDIPFVFSPRPPIKGGDWYAFVLWANGYTGTESSHLAWMKDFPDPVNPTGLSYSMETLGSTPYKLSFIGADL